MKIRPEHFETLARLCGDILSAKPQAASIYKANGLSATRFRFDIFHAAMRTAEPGFAHSLYQYMNDDHIETALKRIVAY